MPTELQQIQQFYKDCDLPLSTEWLTSCIEWCKEGNLPPNYTIKDMQTIIYKQWLVLDMRDVEVASLPRNLSNEKKYCLKGRYYLQMMQVVDISKPKLWQLQRIRNNVAKNTEVEKDFGKRVLQLTFTDGVQEVEAMEFQPIPCLSINLFPGTKIMITGPLMVRNGRLMLKSENVKHLGGSVDEIRVQFAAENVLARALRLEENPNPYAIDENALEVADANTTTQGERAANSQNYTALNQTRNQNSQVQPRTNPNTNRNIIRNTHNESIPRTQSTVPYRQDIPPEFQVDDDLLRELEADFEENSLRNTINSKISNRNTSFPNLKPSASKATTKQNQNKRSRECSSPDLFEEMEIDDELLNEHFDQIDADHMASNVRSTVRSERLGVYSSSITERLDSKGFSNRSIKNPKVSSDLEKFRGNKNTKALQDIEISSSSVSKTKPHDEEVVTLDDSFDDIDIDLHLDNIDEEMANMPSSTQKRNDLKERLRSPELKSCRIGSKNTYSISLKKPPASSKKLTQGTLNFDSSKRHGLNMPVQNPEDYNPFSIFQKPPQKSINCGVGLSKPGPSDTFRLSSNLPQKPFNTGFSDFESEYSPAASSTLSNLPQGASNFGSSSLQSKHLPSTLSTASIPPDKPVVLSPEIQDTSPVSSKILPIEKLKKILPNIGKGKFKIKAKFKKVAEKLQHTDDGYNFVIKVEDSTGDLVVRLHTDLVTSIVGVPPDELERMRALALQGDEEVKNIIMKVLLSLHQMCLKLDNVLELQVTRGDKHPVVIHII